MFSFFFQEVDVYIEHLQEVYGEFRYAPYKTFLDPENELKQLQIFLPKYKNQKPYSKILREKFQESLGDQICLSIDESEQTISTQANPSDKESELEIKSDNIENCEDEQVDQTDEKDENIYTETDLKTQEENVCPVESPINDTVKLDKEKTEEGYGTDDNTADDIDLERRKAFVDPDHNSFLSEEIMEDEDDADTQVPNNISVDNLFKGKVKIRGGLNVTPGNTLWSIFTGISNYNAKSKFIITKFFKS